MAAEDQRRTRMETIARVAQTYYGAILAVEDLKAAGQAVRSAEADLRRAEDVHAAGISTDVCLASTTFAGQRQLFLRINDNYNLDEFPMA